MAGYTSLSDHELWALFIKGDKSAFKSLHSRYYASLFYYGSKMDQDESFLEDTLQDLFLKLWQKRQTLSHVQHVRSYIFKTYSHLLIDALKKEQKTSEVSLDEIELRDENLNIEDTLVFQQHASDQRHQLRAAFKKLSKRQQEVLYLFYVKGFNYKKIEETLSIRYQTIRNCMHSAIKTLRIHMSKDAILIILHWQFLTVMDFQPSVISFS